VDEYHSDDGDIMQSTRYSQDTVTQSPVQRSSTTLSDTIGQTHEMALD